MLMRISKIGRWGSGLGLCIALLLAQGCVHAQPMAGAPAGAEGQRLEDAEQQAAKETQKAALARKKAEAQQVRAEAEAQKVAAQKARKEAALADAEAKKIAAEEAKRRTLAEKQAADQARLAESASIRAEREKVRAAALAAKDAEKQARAEAAQAAAQAKETAAAELARQHEQERQAAAAAKQQAVAARQAEEMARRTERDRIKAANEQARADARAPKAAEDREIKDLLSPEDLAVSSAPSDYVLRAGDEIDIQVYREPELSGTFKIDPSGDIRHSLAGSIPLAGKTVSGAEAFFTKRLAKDYLVNPRVIIKMVSTQSSQIVVLGAVKNPGVYPLPIGDSMTLLQAIAGAGGFTELASPERVRIVRKNPDNSQTTLRVRVASLLAGKGRQEDIPLEPNDVIMVPEVVF